MYTETVSGAATADLAADALVRMSETFGDYPWPDLVLAEVGSGGGFSMEYPRMIHLTRGKVADTYVVYHEVAHQWFYGQLGNDQQREPWLDEAFADFSARWLMGIGENQCSTRPVDSEVFAWEAGATTGGDWTSCNGYFHAVFYRGTEFITAVRSAMGDDAFFSAMRSWVDRYRHGFVTGDRLLRHLQSRTDANLAPVYAAYLEDPVVAGCAARRPASSAVTSSALVAWPGRRGRGGDPRQLLVRGEVDVVDRVAGASLHGSEGSPATAPEPAAWASVTGSRPAAEEAADRDAGRGERPMVGAAIDVDRVPGEAGVLDAATKSAVSASEPGGASSSS